MHEPVRAAEVGRRVLSLVVLFGILLFVTGCAGSSSTNSSTAPATYTVGGTVSGLAGSGLVLQINGSNNLAMSANGPFTFTAALATGTAYNVTVLTQPTNPSQTCVATSGSGSIGASNVTGVLVTCTTNTFTVGGTISGLSGTGLVLQDNGGNNLTVSAGATSFTFTTAIASGAAYRVTIFSQPSGPAQTCAVTSGSGTVASANVASVVVVCTTNTFTIGGTISGLSGTGLVLQDNGGNNLPVSAGASSFTFTSGIASGAAYSVTVLTQPSSPAQICMVANGSGTVASSNVASVVVTCTTTVTYSIGGTVNNLAGTGGGLQLQDNGGDTLLVNANGTFTFPTPIASGSAYSVTVSTQPSSPAQTCAVTQGTGIATANVANVAVNCGHREWTWVNGNNVANQSGTYGTFGTAAPGNVPGARYGASHWTDTAGNVWIFGGVGYASGNLFYFQNDLWKYSAGQWTWVGGSNTALQGGTYGTQGVAAPGNMPGARYGSETWTDAAGNFWLFGGVGFDSVGTQGYLNDLWEYSAGQWTWKSGSNMASQNGTYGTQGVTAVGSVPGGRRWAASWTDAAGSFWLFGGVGLDSSGTTGDLNDLWEYSAGQWTWVSGANVANQGGSYGTQGTAASGNVPGARTAPVSWRDAAGNFWLFGGAGLDSTATAGTLNDLWEYGAGQWTWMGGSNTVLQAGTYGVQGTAAAANIPGARQEAISWTDAAGDFWLFGGAGLDSVGTAGALNDLWEYTAGQWTWMGGSNVANQAGAYGTEGTAAPGNLPGARNSASSWTDAAGNLWFFGGFGFDSAGTQGYLNDLWEYRP